MSNFEETIARMKGLYTYGKELNEGNDFKSHTLEYHAIAADGKSYGIIRECNKYYIKSAPKDKEMVAEAYDYLGGFCNRGNYEYKSYANALKNFELKMASINEACEGNVNIATLDPFKKEEFLVEGTEKMKNEIARQRQIMYNASVIMNESSTNFKPVCGDGAENNAKQPEAKTGKRGDEDLEKTTANPEYKGSDKGQAGGKGPDKKVGPFNQSVNEGKCCEKCGSNPCTCEQCNEEAGDIGDAPLMPNTENWGTEGIGKGKEPQQVGWEMDGQQNVNEETSEWDEGLPCSAGVGDADTDHNNDPFNNSINEGEEDGNETDDNGEEGGEDNGENGEDFGGEDGDASTDTDFDAGLDDDFCGEDGDEFGDEDFGEEGDEFGGEDNDEDLRAEIESLRAELEALKSQINGGEDDLGGEDFGGEDDLGDEDFGGEEFGGEEFGGEDFGEEGDEFGGEDDFGGENPDGEIEECGFEGMMESKQQKMDRIVESVVKRILKEDELHVFGKHPGYRKKPMELPTTGEDQNQWGRDWNDDSVHSEEPFGSKIGNGDPFTELVNAVTKDVMYQLKKGIPIEGDKKKED